MHLLLWSNSLAGETRPPAGRRSSRRPAWLQIAAILARADEAECSVIRDIADVSDASLSKNLSALAVVGCVLIE